ncbi:hypothetical protein ACFLR8_02035 [Bacteroidota bacterium]
MVLIILAGPVLAQTNTNSPYSRFGLGQMAQPGFGKSRAIGGIGIALRDNNQINYLNPASYTAQDSMSFIFDFGIMGNYTYSETSLGNEKWFGMNMDHIAMSFPITKWWGASIGVLPYSRVGYSIKEEDHDDNIGYIDYVYTGNGGLNQFYMGTSVIFFKSLSLGANFKYLFGSIDLNRSVNFPIDETPRSITEVESKTVIKDFIIDLGIQYSLNFSENYNITMGVIFDNKTNVKAENRVLKQNTFPGNITPIDSSTTLNPKFILEESDNKGSIVIPTNVGAGLTFRYNKKITFGLDYYQQDWTNSIFFSENEPLTKSSSIHGGFELIPDPQALRGYHKHVAYRLGGHYQNSYLKLKGEQLKDYGISFGVGLPLKNTKSSFNMAWEVGRMGTLENSLIRENYMFLSFSVTLHDFWFIKRKFD